MQFATDSKLAHRLDMFACIEPARKLAEQRVGGYIHDLIAQVDPAGDVALRFDLEQQRDGFARTYREVKRELARAKRD